MRWVKSRGTAAEDNKKGILVRGELTGGLEKEFNDGWRTGNVGDDR